MVHREGGGERRRARLWQQLGSRRALQGQLTKMRVFCVDAALRADSSTISHRKEEAMKHVLAAVVCAVGVLLVSAGESVRR